MRFTLWFALLCFVSPLQGEIQKVIVHWRGLSCNAQCAQMIQQRYAQTPGVAGVTLFPQAQAVELLWQPNYPFTYRAMKTPLQMVGPGLEDLRVKVRGTIQPQGNQFWLISMGDNTPFFLMGPVTPQPGGQTQFYSYVYHPLSPDMQAQLLQAYQQSRVVIADGQIFMPERSPPLILIVTNLQIVQPELHPR